MAFCEKGARTERGETKRGHSKNREDVSLDLVPWNILQGAKYKKGETQEQASARRARWARQDKGRARIKDRNNKTNRAHQLPLSGPNGPYFCLPCRPLSAQWKKGSDQPPFLYRARPRSSGSLMHAQKRTYHLQVHRKVVPFSIYFNQKIWIQAGWLAASLL